MQLDLLTNLILLMADFTAQLIIKTFHLNSQTQKPSHEPYFH